MRRFDVPPELRWWPRKRRPIGDPPSLPDAAAELVGDCEAFLLGKYAELLDARSEPVPVWAWTNVLAHGCRDDIDRAAEGVESGGPSARKWRRARALVACEVIEAVSCGVSLEDIQREVLAPLELGLAGLRGVWTWTPQHWLGMMRAALQCYREPNGT